MKPVIVLAYDGGFAGAAISALARRYNAEIVTITVDIGQSRDARAVRDVALTAGAVRAHVADAVDDFVRQCVLPRLQSGRGGVPAGDAPASLAHPIIAAHLVDVARREGTPHVAHGGGDGLTAAIRALDAALQVLTVDIVRQPAPTASASARHLLERPVADPALARGIPANLEIEFDAAVPVAINGVSLTLAELMESLSLIGGQHGIGHAEAAAAPGALVLGEAYRALDRQSGVVRMELLDGRQRVLSADSRTPALVNHA
jgi:argininosuccinate synthase